MKEAIIETISNWWKQWQQSNNPGICPLGARSWITGCSILCFSHLVTKVWLLKISVKNLFALKEHWVAMFAKAVQIRIWKFLPIWHPIAMYWISASKVYIFFWGFFVFFLFCFFVLNRCVRYNQSWSELVAGVCLCFICFLFFVFVSMTLLSGER